MDVLTNEVRFDRNSICSILESLAEVVVKTPVIRHPGLSNEFDCNVYLKREDLQVIRSYKVRGAFNRIAGLTSSEREAGVVCASAGNHAQGVAYACNHLKIKSLIFMPATTPGQKVRKVKSFGRHFVEVRLVGDTFDAANDMAMDWATRQGKQFIHPFDDLHIIQGQATIGLEILDQMPVDPDVIIVPVGGGGLAAGLGSFMKIELPKCLIVGVEPMGAPAMKESLEAGKLVTLDSIDTFVDGASVSRVGELTFGICRNVIDHMELVPEGKVCSTMLRLYDEDGMILEPAGALSISSLEQMRDQIRGKTIVCIISGGNNDVTRTSEIRERALMEDGLKHYFIIRFAQRSGALREFLNEVLGPDDDITHFEYTKKNNRDSGPALVGIELKQRMDYEGLISRMESNQIQYQWLNESPMLFDFIV